MDGEAIVSAPRREQRADVGAATREARLRGLIDEHVDFIGRTLRAFGVLETDVDDGLQQVCLVLADKLDRIALGAERAFVFETAHRIAFRLRRTRSRRAEVPFDDVVAPDDPRDPERLVDERRAFDVLAHLLDGLPDELRQVFVLYELEDMTMAAIAALLALPPGTVASRLRRARAQFHDRAAAYRRKETRTP